MGWDTFFVFLLILTITGILLNHPQIIDDQSLSSDFKVNGPHKMIYLDQFGWCLANNTDIYITDRIFDKKKALNFPHNSSNITKLLYRKNILYVFLESAIIYRINMDEFFWERIDFIDVNYIYDAYFLRDSLYVLTENGIFTNNLIDVKWVHELPIEYKTSFYDIVKGLHTGYYFKPFLKPLNTLSSFGLIFLILTGILLFMKKIKR